MDKIRKRKRKKNCENVSRRGSIFASACFELRGGQKTPTYLSLLSFLAYLLSFNHQGWKWHTLLSSSWLQNAKTLWPMTLKWKSYEHLWQRKWRESLRGLLNWLFKFVFFTILGVGKERKEWLLNNVCMCVFEKKRTLAISYLCDLAIQLKYTQILEAFWVYGNIKFKFSMF